MSAAEAPGAVLHPRGEHWPCGRPPPPWRRPARDGACVLERHGLAEGRRRPVTGGPGVGLEEEGLALHLRVAGEVPVVYAGGPPTRAGARRRSGRRSARPGGRAGGAGPRCRRPAARRPRGCSARPPGRTGRLRRLSGRRTSKRIPAPRVEATSIGTLEREPPGCPLSCRFSIRSMHWSTRSSITCQWPKWGQVVESRARRGRGAGHGGGRWAAPARIPTVSARGRARGREPEAPGPGLLVAGLSAVRVTAPNDDTPRTGPAGCREGGCGATSRGRCSAGSPAVIQRWPCGPCAWRPRSSMPPSMA